jgi:hypothetical protein
VASQEGLGSMKLVFGVIDVVTEIVVSPSRTKY